VDAHIDFHRQIDEWLKLISILAAFELVFEAVREID
jgi:hypothetical protein|tara:strand:- start:775 stop:882 length:108 start_codon:yes stop_codon:yes gene_type:complete